MTTNSSPIIMQDNHEKPKDLFSAISQLEIIFEAERSGADIPEKIATIKDRIDYFNLGLRSVLTGSVISIILAPLFVSVMCSYLPIFGDFQPSLTDKILAYILSFGYSIAYLMLFIYAARLRCGKISNIIANNIISGTTVGSIGKFFIATTIYGVLHYIVLTKENINLLFQALIKLNIDNDKIQLLKTIIIAIKASLLPAIEVFLYTSIAIATLPWLMTLFIKIKYHREEI